MRKKDSYEMAFGRILFAYKSNAEYLLKNADIEADAKKAIRENTLAVEHDLKDIFADMSADIRRANNKSFWDFTLGALVGSICILAAALVAFNLILTQG